MTEQRFQDCLYRLLNAAANGTCDVWGELMWSVVGEQEDVKEVRSFADDDILMSNKGLTIRLVDGSEYQLTIVKSK